MAENKKRAASGGEKPDDGSKLFPPVSEVDGVDGNDPAFEDDSAASSNKKAEEVEEKGLTTTSAAKWTVWVAVLVALVDLLSMYYTIPAPIRTIVTYIKMFFEQNN